MTRGLRIAATLGLAAVLAAACGGGTSPAPTTGTAVSTTPTPTTPPAPGAGGAATPTVPSSPRPVWGSGPVRVERHPAVPPVPLITGVRSAAHSGDGYDRVVFDVRGALPGYSVQYVSDVRADPSDRPVPVPGRQHLLIVLTPAQAHGDNGAPTIAGVHRVDLPMLKSWAVVGDFEGHVSVAVGLDDVVGYRVGELSGRIYLDVAH